MKNILNVHVIVYLVTYIQLRHAYEPSICCSQAARRIKEWGTKYISLGEATPETLKAEAEI
jgi:hypothetical protein